LIGVAIESSQIKGLVLDFVNLYIATIYVFFYMNPLLYY